MIDRRSFLRAVGFAAAGAMFPQVRIIVPEAPLLPNEQWFGRVREWYTNGTDGRVYVRHDCRFADQQLGCDSDFDSLEHARELIVIHRQAVATLLAAHIEHAGYTFADLKPMPPPPEWAVLL